MAVRLAVYAGSFDPATEGHLDIIRRAAAQFDRLVVAVADNPRKKPTFSAAERVRMIRECVGSLRNVQVDSFKGLMTDYMRSKGATVALRGLRAVSDLEYEFQMASMNRRLHPKLETIFMMPDERHTYISSSIVREIAGLGGGLKGLAPDNVARALRRKFASE